MQTQSGVMTAETGTYRWMAPEVCIFMYFLISWLFSLHNSNFQYKCGTKSSFIEI